MLRIFLSLQYSGFKKNASHSLLYATCAVSEIDISRAAQVVHSSFKLAVSCKFDFFLLTVSGLSHIKE